MNYRIRVRRSEWEIEVESGEKEYVETKFKELQDLISTRSSPSADRGATLAAVPEMPQSRGQSLVEFKRLINPESGTENAVTVAYYLEKEKGQPEFTSKQLIEGLKEGRCNFKNYSDVVLKAKSIGYIMEGSSSKLLRLTESGERWVDSRLGGKTLSDV